jgi:hypothetical protein
MEPVLNVVKHFLESVQLENVIGLPLPHTIGLSLSNIRQLDLNFLPNKFVHFIFFALDVGCHMLHIDELELFSLQDGPIKLHPLH